MSRPQHANRLPAPAALRPLQESPIVAAIGALPTEFQPLLVGGMLRDGLLGRDSKDFDAVVDGAGSRAADLLAERLGVRWFRLGGDRFAAFRFEGSDFRLDLFDREPLSMIDDLRRRDFTVNSMALDIALFELIDPFDGTADLDERRLRATSELSFVDDPLRVVRLVRFASELQDFTIDPATLELAVRSVADLARIAHERIRTELRCAFGRPATTFELLVKLGLYPALWSADSVGDSVVEDIGDRLIRLELRARALEQAGFPVDQFVAAQALLFEPLANGAVEQVRARGLLSNRDAQRIERVSHRTALPGEDAKRRWFLHRAGELWPTALAYRGSYADDAVWDGELAALLELARSDAAAIFAPPPLLDGHELAALLGLAPGPELGEQVLRLRRAQIEGRVRDRDAAVRWLVESEGPS